MSAAQWLAKELQLDSVPAPDANLIDLAEDSIGVLDAVMNFTDVAGCTAEEAADCLTVGDMEQLWKVNVKDAG